MRTGWIFMALLGVNWNAAAADVTVYLSTDGSATTYAAKRIAESIFQRAGTTIAWSTRMPPDLETHGIWVRVTLTQRTPEERLPGALAFAYPFNCSKSITVFHDRIQALAPRPDLDAALLGYVLVHEITHVLQRVDRHSDEGVMKAFWNNQDRSKIFARRLPLSDVDVELIRRGVAVGCPTKPGTLISRSVPGIAGRPD